MGSLALNPLLTLLDSVAQQTVMFETALGTGSEADTVSKGAANNVNTIEAIADSDVQRDLMPSFASRAEYVKQTHLARALAGGPLQHAIDRHYGSVAGLNAFLKTNDARVHPALTRIGFQIDVENQFAPSVLDLATFAVTAAAEGTFTTLTTLETQGYGKAHLQLRATADIGAAAIVVTLSLRKADGSNEEQVVTIPAGTDEDDTIDVGISSDRYLEVLGISITGGTAADGFAVQTVIERAIAL